MQNPIGQSGLNVFMQPALSTITFTSLCNHMQRKDNNTMYSYSVEFLQEPKLYQISFQLYYLLVQSNRFPGVVTSSSVSLLSCKGCSCSAYSPARLERDGDSLQERQAQWVGVVWGGACTLLRGRRETATVYKRGIGFSPSNC